MGRFPDSDHRPDGSDGDYYDAGQPAEAVHHHDRSMLDNVIRDASPLDRRQIQQDHRQGIRYEDAQGLGRFISVAQNSLDSLASHDDDMQ